MYIIYIYISIWWGNPQSVSQFCGESWGKLPSLPSLPSLPGHQQLRRGCLQQGLPGLQQAQGCWLDRDALMRRVERPLELFFAHRTWGLPQPPKWRLALSSSELRQWVKSYKTMRWSGWYSRCLNNGSSLYVHSSNLADHVHQATNSNRKHPPDSVAGMGCVDAWERTSLSWTSPAEKLSRWRHRCRADARTGQNWGSGWEDVSERKSENCRLQKPLNMGIFNIFHRIDDDKRCILWVNVPRNPWQFGTGATQRLGQAQALRKFLRTGGVASGSWNPWNYQGWWMQMAMGRSPWQSSRWISPDDMSVFFPKKHVEELIW